VPSRARMSWSITRLGRSNVGAQRWRCRTPGRAGSPSSYAGGRRPIKIPRSHHRVFPHRRFDTFFEVSCFWFFKHRPLFFQGAWTRPDLRAASGREKSVTTDHSGRRRSPGADRPSASNALSCRPTEALRQIGASAMPGRLRFGAEGPLSTWTHGPQHHPGGE